MPPDRNTRSASGTLALPTTRLLPDYYDIPQRYKRPAHHRRTTTAPIRAAGKRPTQPQAGQTELVLRSLQITEPAMLLRAAAIDEAACDLVTRAAASSRQRNTIDQPMPPTIGAGIRRAARTAAKDLPLPGPPPANPTANGTISA